MKNLFPGHYRPSEDDFKFLWKDGLFVFDTNVLLNLYSYPESAREIFFSVLNRVIERSWIPYHVALEFHRNRFIRVKKSNEPLLELRDRIRASSASIEAEFSKIEFEKRNTGIVDLHDRLRAVRDANTQLAEAIDLACDRLPNISLDDPIGTRIAELFDGRVGAPPADQAALDALVSDGQERYDKKIPPGYKDAKDKRDLQYRDRGITYAGMFGDLILWRQTIAYTADTGKKDVVFITGDGKDDWWSSHEGRTLGPAPELVQEFLTASGAERFWIYRADQFLKNAEQFLKAEEVTEETIAQVKQTADSQHSDSPNKNLGNEVSRTFSTDSDMAIADEGYTPYGKFMLGKIKDKLHRNRKSSLLNLKNTVVKWAKAVHNSEQITSMMYPDFVIADGDGIHGYEIVAPSGLRRQPVEKAIQEACTREAQLNVTDLSVVVAISSEEYINIDEITMEKYTNDIVNIMYDFPVHSVIIGCFDDDDFWTICTINSPKF